MLTAEDLQPGDLLFTRSQSTFGAAIRLGAALRGQPNLDNHVAAFHHWDANGTPWCLEGRPGGVGWRDATDYLKSRWTMNNVLQPKTDAQRGTVCDVMVKLIGTQYDWQAIEMDALEAFGIDLKAAWKRGRRGIIAGHVVCSSGAQYAYTKAALAHPAGDRLTSPADWEQFVIMHEFSK